MEIVVRFFLVGWIINICKDLFIDLIEDIENREFTPLIILVSAFAVACLITWGLCRIGFLDMLIGFIK